MLNTTLEQLRAADVTVASLSRWPREPNPTADALVEITVGKSSARFAIKRRQRAPFRNEIPDLENLRRSLENLGHPLLVAPYITDSLGTALVEAGWSWADDQENYDVRAAGLRLRQRRTSSMRQRAKRLMPTGSGSLAIVRTMIGRREDHEEPLSTTELATGARVSLPRASQVLGALASLELVERTGRGRWRPNRTALLDQFLAEYRGPGGTELLLYSLDEPTAVAVKLARLAPPHSFVTSADVAPDLIAPWRHPTVVIFYAATDLPFDRLGLVEARSRADANVIIREPRDRSIFAVTDQVAKVDDVEVPLADPSQVIWDLQDLDGADRLEAAGMMRKWLLKSP